MTIIKQNKAFIITYFAFILFLISLPVCCAKNYKYDYKTVKNVIELDENRIALIKKGISLVGKTKYRSKAGSNKVSSLGNNPKYLCCSSFVSWCFQKSKIAKIDYSTWDFCHSKKFKQIKKQQLKPGDIGLIQKTRKTGNHVGISVGRNKTGHYIWLHCTGTTGNGVVVNNDNRFKIFYRYKGFK